MIACPCWLGFHGAVFGASMVHCPRQSRSSPSGQLLVRMSAMGWGLFFACAGRGDALPRLALPTPRFAIFPLGPPACVDEDE